MDSELDTQILEYFQHLNPIPEEEFIPGVTNLELLTILFPETYPRGHWDVLVERQIFLRRMLSEISPSGGDLPQSRALLALTLHQNDTLTEIRPEQVSEVLVGLNRALILNLEQRHSWLLDEEWLMLDRYQERRYWMIPFYESGLNLHDKHYQGWMDVYRTLLDLPFVDLLTMITLQTPLLEVVHHIANRMNRFDSELRALALQRHPLKLYSLIILNTSEGFTAGESLEELDPLIRNGCRALRRPIDTLELEFHRDGLLTLLHEVSPYACRYWDCYQEWIRMHCPQPLDYLNMLLPLNYDSHVDWCRRMEHLLPLLMENRRQIYPRQTLASKSVGFLKRYVKYHRQPLLEWTELCMNFALASVLVPTALPLLEIVSATAVPINLTLREEYAVLCGLSIDPTSKWFEKYCRTLLRAIYNHWPFTRGAPLQQYYPDSNELRPYYESLIEASRQSNFPEHSLTSVLTYLALHDQFVPGGSSMLRELAQMDKSPYSEYCLFLVNDVIPPENPFYLLHSQIQQYQSRERIPDVIIGPSTREKILSFRTGIIDEHVYLFVHCLEPCEGTWYIKTSKADIRFDHQMTIGHWAIRMLPAAELPAGHPFTISVQIYQDELGRATFLNLRQLACYSGDTNQ